MSVSENKKGFSIIEVVLVLAIAGLIFLMVFVALPALQRGQRDSARKQDVGSIAAAVNSYISNNRGKLPLAANALGTYSATDGKWSGYLDSVSGAIEQINTGAVPAAGTINAQTTPSLVDGRAAVLFGARCGTSTAGATPSQAYTKGTTRQYIVITLLENGGGTPFCQDS